MGNSVFDFFKSRSLSAGVLALGLFGIQPQGSAQSSKQRPVIDILALDFNQDAETRVFKELLKECSDPEKNPSYAIRFLELPEQNRKEAPSPKQFLLNLCESGYSPNMVQISGHFASQWGGKANRGVLSLDELEKLSCDPRCKDFFNKSIRVKSLLSCNGLLNTPKRNESPEAYIERLLREHHGDFNANQIIEAGLDMYEEANGFTNAERISDLFSKKSLTLGFKGGAPLALAEGGQSEIGYKKTWRQFAQKSGSKNLCDAMYDLFLKTDPAKNSAYLKTLGDSWTDAMNEADAIAKDAAVDCPYCTIQSGEQSKRDALKRSRKYMPRDQYCELIGENEEIQRKALRRTIDKPEWLSKYYRKAVQALVGLCAEDAHCLDKFKDKEKSAMLEMAESRLKAHPVLMHKWDSYQAILLLTNDERKKSRLKGELAAELTQMTKNYAKVQSTSDQRDVYLETLIRTPSDVLKAAIESDQETYSNLYYKSQNYYLKKELRAAFSRSVGSIKQTIYSSGSIFEGRWSADEKTLAIAAADGTARVYSVSPSDGALKEAGRVQIGGKVNSVAYVPAASTRIAVGSADRTLRVLDATPNGMKEVAQRKLDGSVNSVSATSDGALIVAGSSDRTLRVFGLSTDGLRSVAQESLNSEVLSVAVSPDNKKVAASLKDGSVRVYDLSSSGLKDPRQVKFDGAVNSVEFSPDGLSLLAASDDKTARVIAVAPNELKEASRIQGDYAFVGGEFSPDGKRVILSEKNRAVRLCSVEPGALKPLSSLRNDGNINSARFSKDGKRVVLSSDEGNTRVALVGRFVRVPNAPVVVPPVNAAPVTVGNDGSAEGRGSEAAGKGTEAGTGAGGR